MKIHNSLEIFSKNGKIIAKNTLFDSALDVLFGDKPWLAGLALGRGTAESVSDNYLQIFSKFLPLTVEKVELDASAGVGTVTLVAEVAEDFAFTFGYSEAGLTTGQDPETYKWPLVNRFLISKRALTRKAGEYLKFVVKMYFVIDTLGGKIKIEEENADALFRFLAGIKTPKMELTGAENYDIKAKFFTKEEFENFSGEIAGTETDLLNLSAASKVITDGTAEIAFEPLAVTSPQMAFALFVDNQKCLQVYGSGLAPSGTIYKNVMANSAGQITDVTLPAGAKFAGLFDADGAAVNYDEAPNYNSVAALDFSPFGESVIEKDADVCVSPNAALAIIRHPSGIIDLFKRVNGELVAYAMKSTNANKYLNYNFFETPYGRYIMSYNNGTKITLNQFYFNASDATVSATPATMAAFRGSTTALAFTQDNSVEALAPVGLYALTDNVVKKLTANEIENTYLRQTSSTELEPQLVTDGRIFSVPPSSLQNGGFLVGKENLTGFVYVGVDGSQKTFEGANYDKVISRTEGCEGYPRAFSLGLVNKTRENGKVVFYIFNAKTEEVTRKELAADVLDACFSGDLHLLASVTDGSLVIEAKNGEEYQTVGTMALTETAENASRRVEVVGENICVTTYSSGGTEVVSTLGAKVVQGGERYVGLEPNAPYKIAYKIGCGYEVGDTATVKMKASLSSEAPINELCLADKLVRVGNNGALGIYANDGVIDLFTRDGTEIINKKYANGKGGYRFLNQTNMGTADLILPISSDKYITYENGEIKFLT